MKAITTRYEGPTDTCGSRIFASDYDRNSVIHFLDNAFSVDENHGHAALALCNKMGWFGTLIVGDLSPTHRVFTWLNHERLHTPPKNPAGVFVCRDCGCPHVEASAWLILNTDTIAPGEGPTSGIFCPNCDDADKKYTCTLDEYTPPTQPHYSDGTYANACTQCQAEKKTT